MTAGNCRSATTMYEYENRNSELRQSMQHESATEHLIEQCKPHRTIVRAALLQSSPATEAQLRIRGSYEVLCSFGTTATEHGCRLITAVSLHCKLSLVPLLQSMAVVFYTH